MVFLLLFVSCCSSVLYRPSSEPLTAFSSKVFLPMATSLDMCLWLWSLEFSLECEIFPVFQVPAQQLCKACKHLSQIHCIYTSCPSPSASPFPGVGIHIDFVYSDALLFGAITFRSLYIVLGVTTYTCNRSQPTGITLNEVQKTYFYLGLFTLSTFSQSSAKHMFYYSSLQTRTYQESLPISLSLPQCWANH